MSAEIECLNEENGRLRRQINTLEFALRKAEAKLTALEKQEPTAYLAWREGKPCWDGDDCVCEDAVYPVDGDDDRTSMPLYIAAGAAQPVSAKPLTEDAIYEIADSEECNPNPSGWGPRFNIVKFAHAVEAAHNIKEQP